MVSLISFLESIKPSFFRLIDVMIIYQAPLIRDKRDMSDTRTHLVFDHKVTNNIKITHFKKKWSFIQLRTAMWTRWFNSWNMNVIFSVIPCYQRFNPSLSAYREGIVFWCTFLKIVSLNTLAPNREAKPNNAALFPPLKFSLVLVGRVSNSFFRRMKGKLQAKRFIS